MDLVLLVYLVTRLDVINPIIELLAYLTLCGLILFLIAKAVYWLDPYYGYENNRHKREAGVAFCNKYISIFFKTICVCTAIYIVLPTQRVAYTMLGAYAAQKVVENPTAERLTSKTLSILESKLDEYARELTKPEKTK